MMTRIGYEIPDEMLPAYLNGLVGQFFKILPLKESNEPSYIEYIQSLQIELVGTQGLLEMLREEKMWLALIAILEYLSTHDCETRVVKREVFKAIGMVKKLARAYTPKEE